MTAPSRSSASVPVLRADDISVTFGSRNDPFVAVDRVSLTLNPGEIVGLVGESGSGKSTVSRVICGLQRDYTGRVVFGDAELQPKRTSAQWRVVQMVFQDPFASLDSRFTVRETLTEVIRHHKLASGRALRERCSELMDMVRLPEDFLDRTPSTMSGGQRQRVAIARALAVEPQVIVADEAVSALDVSVQAEIIDLFARLRQELGLSILFISHDLAVVRNLCDSVNVIYHGSLVESGPTDLIFATPRHDYTKALLASIPTFSSAYLRELDAQHVDRAAVVQSASGADAVSGQGTSDGKDLP